MTTAYPLQWPDGWPRTPKDQQDPGHRFGTMRTETVKRLDGSSYTTSSKFDITFAKARDKLYAELERLGASNVVISSNHKPDIRGVPIESKRSVGDDGIAIYFTYRRKQMAMACDRFLSAAANMRSLGLAIDAMRQLERHGGGHMMERAFEGFAALPAPHASRHWTSVLGLDRNASVDTIESTYRALARKHHPDAGGSVEKMAEINAARDQALAALA